MSDLSKYVLIVAGGSGSRMKSALPKQFIELCGKPVLMHTIEVFYKFDNTVNIILVLPARQSDYWKQLCRKHNFTIKHTEIQGGETRFHSVKNGLSVIHEEGLVAIHDGVRPLVSHDTISRCFEKAAKYGNAIPCMPVYETTRQVNDDRSIMLDRSLLRLVQTPQVFSCSQIRKAYEQAYDEDFTDDASVLERTGMQIQLAEGNRENIKITDPLDLILAEAILKSLSSK
jgi:2-C-methyl-D-erythritol 4-phosphate cytidylyltransferase